MLAVETLCETRRGDMYRLVILFIAAAAAAPQDNSITYIKTLPPPDEVPQPEASYTSSHFENLPTSQDISDHRTEEDSKQEYLDTSGDRTGEQVTDSIEDEIKDSTETAEATTTEIYEPKTTHKPKFQKKAPPKFYSKLSYFEKPTFSAATNLVDRSGKRHFRSRCRCERISNCPKLQITVPRCPEEYFLCCF